jgi:ABC-type branched-subunit amino acid transport system ATPase component/predicted MFS family arabinose efflux permease
VSDLADDPEPTGASALTKAVLDEEAARLSAQHDAAEARVLSDAELPGVGDEKIGLGSAVAVRGAGLLASLSALNAVDQLDAGVVSILAPDIQRTLNTSDTVIAVATVGSTLFLIVGGLVLGRLADRMRRTTIIGAATVSWGALAAATAFVPNAFLYFVARALTGLGRSNTQVVQNPVLADAYPIGARARIYAVHSVVGRFGGLVLPLAVGAMVTGLGTDQAWRWGFIAVAVPTVLIGLYAWRLEDPPRGQYEQQATIGEVLHDGDGPPISLGAAYQRIMQIRTYRSALVAFTAVGFSFVSVPVFVSLYLDDRFGLSALERSLVAMIPGLLSFVVTPLVARRFDALYRRSPPLTMGLIGVLFIPVGLLSGLQMLMPTAVAFTVVATIAGVILAAQFSLIPPLFAAVNPYYLRAQGTAIGIGLIFGAGGFGGAVLGGLIADAFGLQAAVIAIAVPANLIGGLLMINGARFLRNDLSLIVEEIREAEDEQEGRREQHGRVPVLQLRNVDFAYGPVQVLFGIDLDLHRGEVLALLGTNGAGKSTVLRVISGLGIPSRGVVRLNGYSVTLCSPETRVRWGIHQLTGGNAVFDPLSVLENLQMASFLYRGDPADRQRRIDRSLEVFPELRDRLGDPAGSLSGGQQQMLGLAMALMHEPEVLIIDELSLGLAPVMIEQLLTVIDRLKAQGQSMIIVEQSLNLALAIADRAIFLEKGQVRFEGPAAELIERDDLARAVFLGSEQV